MNLWIFTTIIYEILVLLPDAEFVADSLSLLLIVSHFCTRSISPGLIILVIILLMNTKAMNDRRELVAYTFLEALSCNEGCWIEM